MIVRLFRSNYSILSSIIWLILLFVLKSRFDWSYPANEYSSLSKQLIMSISSSAILEPIILFVLIAFIAFSSYLFNSSFIVDQYRSFLPMHLVIVMLAAGESIFMINPAHIGLLFIFLALLTLFNLEHASKAQNNITNASLLISIGSLLDPKLLYFIPLVWISSLVFKRLNSRTFFASIIGLILPYVIVLSISYLRDNLTFWYSGFSDHFSFFNYSYGEINQGFLVFLAYLCVILLFALFSIQKKTERLKTNSRKVIGIIFLFFFLNIIYFALGMISLRNFFVYSSFPLSILLSIHFNHIRPKVSTALIFILMIASLIGFIVEF